MHYTLCENIALRGWEDRPYALRDLSSGQTIPVSENVFNTLSFCNGIMDCNGFLIPEKYKQIIKFLLENKIIRHCEKNEHNNPDQAYQKYPCKFIQIAHWSITGKCNMNCRHCFMSAPQAKYGELTHEKCLDIIEQLAQAGIGLVNLTGGEPLIRDDFLIITKTLKEKGIFLNQIYTNGMLVNQELLDSLKELGLHPEFSLSFDGVGWHDWLRGIDGAEEMTVRAIRLLADNGFPVAIESAFHQNSIHSMEKTMHLLASLGVKHWKINPVSNSGNWISEDRNLDLSIEELYDYYLKMVEGYFKAGSPITMMLGGFFQCAKGKTDYVHPCKKHGSEEEPLCLSARNMMYICADAKLLPCMPLAGLTIPPETPSLNDMTLIEALSDSLYLKRIEMPVSALIEHNLKCAKCEHRKVCGGGCRAGALMESDSNDYLAIDPATCTFFKGGYEEKIRHIAEQYI